MQEKEVISKLNEYGIGIDAYCIYTNIFLDNKSPFWKTYPDKHEWVDQGDGVGHFKTITEGCWKDELPDDLLFYLAQNGLKLVKI